MTTVMPLVMADFSVGHSADGSVADTSSAFAPLVIAAWMAGICEAGVAAVPLVSLPDSPSVPRAASGAAGVHAVGGVKYGLPRFFGITKTLSPFFSAPDEAAATRTATNRTCRKNCTPRAERTR